MYAFHYTTVDLNVAYISHLPVHPRRIGDALQGGVHTMCWWRASVRYALLIQSGGQQCSKYIGVLSSAMWQLLAVSPRINLDRQQHRYQYTHRHLRRFHTPSRSRPSFPQASLRTRYVTQRMKTNLRIKLRFQHFCYIMRTHKCPHLTKWPSRRSPQSANRHWCTRSGELALSCHCPFQRRLDQ